MEDMPMSESIMETTINHNSEKNYWKIFGLVMIGLILIGAIVYGYLYSVSASKEKGYIEGVADIIKAQVNQSVIYYFDNSTGQIEIKPMTFNELCGVNG